MPRGRKNHRRLFDDPRDKSSSPPRRVQRQVVVPFYFLATSLMARTAVFRLWVLTNTTLCHRWHSVRQQAVSKSNCFWGTLKAVGFAYRYLNSNHYSCRRSGETWQQAVAVESTVTFFLAEERIWATCGTCYTSSVGWYCSCRIGFLGGKKNVLTKKSKKYCRIVIVQRFLNNFYKHYITFF